MMQVSVTFTDDCELEKLRDFAANCGLCQIGRISRKLYYNRVKFTSIRDDGKQTNETEKQSKE